MGTGVLVLSSLYGCMVAKTGAGRVKFVLILWFKSTIISPQKCVRAQQGINTKRYYQRYLISKGIIKGILSPKVPSKVSYPQPFKPWVPRWITRANGLIEGPERSIFSKGEWSLAWLSPYQCLSTPQSDLFFRPAPVIFVISPRPLPEICADAVRYQTHRGPVPSVRRGGESPTKKRGNGPTKG